MNIIKIIRVIFRSKIMILQVLPRIGKYKIHYDINNIPNCIKFTIIYLLSNLNEFYNRTFLCYIIYINQNITL